MTLYSCLGESTVLLPFKTSSIDSIVEITGTTIMKHNDHKLVRKNEINILLDCHHMFI